MNEPRGDVVNTLMGMAVGGIIAWPLLRPRARPALLVPGQVVAQVTQVVDPVRQLAYLQSSASQLTAISLAHQQVVTEVRMLLLSLDGHADALGELNDLLQSSSLADDKVEPMLQAVADMLQRGKDITSASRKALLACRQADQGLDALARQLRGWIASSRLS
jgi:hypothetical protein